MLEARMEKVFELLLDAAGFDSVRREYPSQMTSPSEVFYGEKAAA